MYLICQEWSPKIKFYRRKYCLQIFTYGKFFFIRIEANLDLNEKDVEQMIKVLKDLHPKVCVMEGVLKNIENKLYHKKWFQSYVQEA